MGDAGAVLEAYKRRLGGSLGRLGAVLRALEAMLERSGCQKAPKMEPKRVPNRAPEATRAEYCETLIFKVQGSLCGVKVGSQMGSESHLRRGSFQKASWRPLGAILEASGAEKVCLEASWSRLGALKTVPRCPDRDREEVNGR